MKKLLTENVDALNSGLTAVESELGWMVNRKINLLKTDSSIRDQKEQHLKDRVCREINLGAPSTLKSFRNAIELIYINHFTTPSCIQRAMR
ncbi:hypothetical protein NPIL_661021 [Nephila pilipes]|uniref:Uncharacterized protein n=1 Tax=Nephila pilipes TaxID=299642 RepID=A0A8X6TDY9_NEPPI|nr:hypothetical protein NPIL_661021 [Nephila pilipes]